MCPCPEGSRKGSGGFRNQEGGGGFGPWVRGQRWRGRPRPGPGLVLAPLSARSWGSWLVERAGSGTASPHGRPPTWPAELSDSVLGRHLVDILGKATPSCCSGAAPSAVSLHKTGVYLASAEEARAGTWSCNQRSEWVWGFRFSRGSPAGSFPRGSGQAKKG